MSAYDPHDAFDTADLIRDRADYIDNHFVTLLRRAMAEINHAARLGPELSEMELSRAMQHLRSAQVEALRQRNIKQETTT